MKKTFLIIVSFHLFILTTEISAVSIILTSSHQSPVKLKEKVTFTCKVSNITHKGIYPVLFLRNTIMVSENGDAFKHERYDINCINETEYIFTIKEFNWDDKGKWDCNYHTVTESVNLDIYVPSNVSISITPKPFLVESPNLGPESIPMKHESFYTLQGRGTKFNPYDLRKVNSVNIICKSDCGYPSVNHLFSFKNSSNFSVSLNDKTFNFASNVCERERSTSSSISTLEFNCSKYKLHGLINLTCSTFHSYNEKLKLTISEENIFILCPTDPVQWWIMTYGEMVNTVVGCLVGFILLMYFFLILCRWKSYKHKNNYDSCQEDNGNTKLGRGYRV